MPQSPHFAPYKAVAFAQLFFAFAALVTNIVSLVGGVTEDVETWQRLGWREWDYDSLDYDGSYDGSYVVSCAPNCQSYMPGNGWCDHACYNSACNFDNGDCSSIMDAGSGDAGWGDAGS